MTDWDMVEPWRQALVAAERRAQRAETVAHASRTLRFAEQRLAEAKADPASHSVYEAAREHSIARATWERVLAAYDTEASNGE